MALARHGLPHQGHPSEKYSLNWETEQAGSGWLGVGNYYGFSIVLIKKMEIDEPRAEFPNLQRAFHENIVGLVEAFYDNTNIYLAYYYHSFAVNLSQVISTPTIKLNELELASISRSVLRGLEYIHEKLQIVHGNVDGDNILLCPDGVIKLGECKTQNSTEDEPSDGP
ncbi:hypothetical protein N7490_005209 [Penicillium lividum]|nr:hypothetical protein N7490_005209 [Penicillium lividum]